MKFYNNNERALSIEITPLIDLVFLLVIFFVVTSKIEFIFCSLLEKSITSISGSPIEVESVNELDQKPSNLDPES